MILDVGASSEVAQIKLCQIWEPSTHYYINYYVLGATVAAARGAARSNWAATVKAGGSGDVNEYHGSLELLLVECVLRAKKRLFDHEKYESDVSNGSEHTLSMRI